MCTLSGMWSEFKEVSFALSERGLGEERTGAPNSSGKEGQGLLGALGALLNPHDFSLLSRYLQGPSLSRKKKKKVFPKTLNTLLQLHIFY